MEQIGEGKRRKFTFDCPECGERNSKWIDKAPTTEIDKISKKIGISCIYCEAYFSIEPNEGVK